MELDRTFICKSKECCWLVVGFCFFSQRSWTKQIMSNNWFLKPPRICDSCLASSTTKCDQRMHFKNFGPSQAWSLTEISHEQYLAMPGQISVWRSVPGWTLESCVFWLDAQRLLGTWKRPSGKYFEGAHRKISLRPLTFRKRWCYIGLYPRRNGHRLFEVRVPWISNSWKKESMGFCFRKPFPTKKPFLITYVFWWFEVASPGCTYLGSQLWERFTWAMQTTLNWVPSSKPAM